MKKHNNIQQKKYFEKLSGHYKKHNEKNIEFLENLKQIVSPYIFGDVLDIGNGGIIIFDIKKAKSITISDMVKNLVKSPEVVEGGTLKKIEKSNFNITQANVLDLPFKNNSFDVVMMFDVVHHLSVDSLIKSKENIKVAFSEVYRVLRKNGKFLLLENCPQPWYQIIQTFGYEFGYWTLSKFEKPLPYFLTEKQIKTYLKRQKFNLKKQINMSWGKNAYLPLFPNLYPPGWLWGMVLKNRFFVGIK